MKVYTGGTFDLFHVGHARLLRACKRIAGHQGSVVVALNTDEFVQGFKGKAPAIPYEMRREVLLASRYVDEVIPNEGGYDSKPTIMRVSPDFIVIGSDWASKDYYKQMGFTQQWLDDLCIQLIYVPYTEGVSTTNLRKQINA